MSALETRINPFERIQSTEGTVFLLLAGMALGSRRCRTLPIASLHW